MLYLSKLESKLDEALSKETRESLTEWIGHKRNKPLNQNKMSEQNNDGDYDYDCPPNPKIVLPIIGIIWMLVIVFLLLN